MTTLTNGDKLTPGISNGNKTAVSLSNADKTGLHAHLWDGNNLPWSPDENLPWQDELQTAITDLSNANKL